MFDKKLGRNIAVSMLRLILVTAVLVSMLFSSAYAYTDGVDFPDVNQGDWFGDWVYNLAGRGAIAGYPDGTFGPNKSITRGEFIKIAISTVENGSFYVADEGEHWAMGMLRYANEEGIVLKHEIPSTRAGLDQPINRYEMARIMIRINEKLQGEARTSVTDVDKVITDYKNLPQTYRSYVEQAYMKGLLQGDNAGNYNGDKGGTRAEACVMVVRLVDESKRAEVVVEQEEVVTVSEGVEVNAKGQMAVDQAREYIKTAVDTMRVVQKDGKYYLTITLEELPEGHYWQPGYKVLTDKSAYLCSSYSNDLVGAVGYQEWELENVTSDAINGVDDADLSFYLHIRTADERMGSVVWSMHTAWGNQVLEGILDGNNMIDTMQEYDTSKIFEEWK